MVTRDPADVALGELDRGVAEVPRGSNTGPRVAIYQRHAHIARSVEWCAYFVMWCYGEAWGWPRLYRSQREFYLHASARTLKETWEREGHLVGRNASLAKRNDVIVVRRTGGSGMHVGLVVEDETDVIHSVDGNLSDKVKRCYRRREELGEDLVGLLRFTKRV